MTRVRSCHSCSQNILACKLFNKNHREKIAVSWHRVYSVITPAATLYREKRANKSFKICIRKHVHPLLSYVVCASGEKRTREAQTTNDTSKHRARALVHIERAHALRNSTVVTLWRYPKLTDVYTRRCAVCTDPTSFIGQFGKSHVTRAFSTRVSAVERVSWATFHIAF